jgi:glycosyltransferase involved in cell wall biosynthesis
MVKVSVVIPSYNREEVRRAVRSALNQSVQEIEVIVVDDHSSTTASSHLSDIEDDRLEIVRHKVNKGGSAARNTGIKKAKGEYIAFLDDDDEWKREKLEKQLEKLKESAEDYIGCYSKVIYSSERKKEVVGSTVEGDFTEELLKTEVEGNFGSTLIVETEIVKQIGGFDEDFERHQDWEFVLRLLEKGKIGVIDEPLAITHSSEGFFSPETTERAKKKLFQEFEEKFNEMSFQDRRGAKAKHYIGLSAGFAHKKKIQKAIYYYLKALTIWPILPLKSYARPPYLFIKSSLN